MSKISAIESKSETNFYILVANDGYSTASGLRVSARKIAESRLKAERWNLYKTTRNRQQIKSGDELLIYLAGAKENSKSFIAKASVSEVANPSRREGEIGA